MKHGSSHGSSQGSKTKITTKDPHKGWMKEGGTKKKGGRHSLVEYEGAGTPATTYKKSPKRGRKTTPGPERLEGN